MMRDNDRIPLMSSGEFLCEKVHGQLMKFIEMKRSEWISSELDQSEVHKVFFDLHFTGGVDFDQRVVNKRRVSPWRMEMLLTRRTLDRIFSEITCGFHLIS